MRQAAREMEIVGAGKFLLTVAAALALRGLALAEDSPPPPAQPTASPQVPASAKADPSRQIPDVLDGLESLKLVKDQEFGPPIVGSGELSASLQVPNATVRGTSGSSYMRALDSTPPGWEAPSLSGGTPEAPSLSPAIAATPLPRLPDDFALPQFGQISAMALATQESSLQQRPLGTVGAPVFMGSGHSFPLGNGRVRFGVSVVAGAAYNSNVFATPSQPKGDSLFTLQPSVYLETGKKGTMRFLWSPSFIRYSKYRQFNSDNQNFLFASRYRWTKLRVGLDIGYLAQSGLFLNSQGQSSQQNLIARLFAGYALTKKTDLSLDFRGMTTQSSAGGKQFQGTLTAAVDYSFSRKTKIGAAVAFGYSSWEGGTTTTEAFLLRLLYSPTAKLVFKGEGGVQFRQTSSTSAGASSTVTTVVNLSVTYNHSSKTYVSLRLFRNMDMDAFSAGTTQITTGAEATGAWKISSHSNLQAGLAAGNVENLAPNGQDSESYQYIQANLALSYALRNDVNVSLFNYLQQRFNDTKGANYLSNTTGMSLGMGF